jgi:hypothetical protein
MGVLGQMKGPTFAPVAYLSKQLDLVIKGWQPCLHALATAALLIQEASKLTFGRPTTVLSPHQLTPPPVPPLSLQPVSLKITAFPSHFYRKSMLPYRLALPLTLPPCFLMACP